MMYPHKDKLLLVLLLCSLLLFSIPAAGQETGPIYIVEAGDTLTAIAFKFGTTVEELAQLNSISNPSSIVPGQQLVIPGYPGVTGILRTNQVPFGHNLASLAEANQITPDTIIRLNRIVNPERIYIDQEIIVPQPEDIDLPASTSTWAFSTPGSTRLEYAVMQAKNPMFVRDPTEADLAYWLVPGSLLRLDSTAPAQSGLPEFIQGARIIPSTLIQGHVLELDFELSQSGSVAGTLDGIPLNFLPASDSNYIALQGIHALAEPGLVDLVLEFQDVANKDQMFLMTQPIQIVEGGYGRESLSVPSQTIDPENTGPEDERIANVISMVSEDRLWEGPFQYPSEYYESFPSYFGTRRSYNGSTYSYYHTGLDFFGGTSTPILAPARGRVIFTDSLTVRGNSTYIDHGWGVITGYLHQSEILVQEGQIVEPGQIIGYVGGTGRVTGPHLHWEIWVGGIPVDPLDWMENTYP
jgi:murein DD-endopeptidase MepM/ murein hydrolase activator NlpD